MTLPTAAEITSLFLYGTNTAPFDKVNPSIPSHSAPPALQINRTDFMSTGPGRFGGPAQIEIVKRFSGVNLDSLILRLKIVNTRDLRSTIF
jgi:hypothetical protein